MSKARFRLSDTSTDGEIFARFGSVFESAISIDVEIDILSSKIFNLSP